MTNTEIILLSILVVLIMIFLVMLASTAKTCGPEGIGPMLKNIRKSHQDSRLAGVCAGLGEHTPIPTWIWRVIFLTLLFAGGMGLLAYVIFAICMPSARDSGV